MARADRFFIAVLVFEFNQMIRTLLQTIVKNFKLDKDFDKLTGSWEDIVNNYDKIKDELEKHGKENSAKILADGSIFDKVNK